MPTLLYKGDGKQFSITGGCLAIMGRTSCAAENILYKMNARSMESIKTVKFQDILQLSVASTNTKYLKVFEAYMSMFPFMRCVKTPYEKILTTTDCTFDVENYSQNEVMHAMFHIRQLAYPMHVACKPSSFMIATLHTLTQEGVPFWKAYTLCMMPFHINPRFPKKDFNRVLEADANTFMLKHIPLSNFKKLISGRKPKPKYVEGTVTQNAHNEKAYAQNITTYLATDLRSEPTVFDLIDKTIDYAQANKRGGCIVDAFGIPIVSSQERFEMDNRDLINALDKALHVYGITGKGKVTC